MTDLLNLEPEISIIVPAYNEEQRLGKMLERYQNYFEPIYGQKFEILVILNGCKDNTEGIAQKYSEKYSTIKYSNFSDPIGKGGAIAEGYKIAAAKLVAYSDADGSAGPEMIEKLFQVLRDRPEVACAIGSRNLPESQTQGRTGFRKILTRGFNLTVNTLFGLNLRDTQCGAKALRHETMQAVLPHLSISNLSFDVNLLFEVKRTGGKIEEVPIVWTDDHDSTIKKPIKTSLIMFLSVLRLRAFYSPLKKIYWLIHPFSELAWKILLTEKEREYRRIRHD
jgi:glycosyltransferase involved in cell wall biosynthesis